MVLPSKSNLPRASKAPVKHDLKELPEVPAVQLQPIEPQRRYYGKVGILDVLIDGSGSVEQSLAAMKEAFLQICGKIGSEFHAFREQILVRASWISGDLWLGTLMPVHLAELPYVDFGGSSPIIDSDLELFNELANDLQSIGQHAQIVHVSRIVISDFIDTTTDDRSEKIAQLRALQTKFASVQITLVAPDDGYNAEVAAVIQRENGPRPIMLVDALAGGGKVFELLSDKLRLAAHAVSNPNIRSPRGNKPSR